MNNIKILKDIRDGDIIATVIRTSGEDIITKYLCSIKEDGASYIVDLKTNYVFEIPEGDIPEGILSLLDFAGEKILSISSGINHNYFNNNNIEKPRRNKKMRIEFKRNIEEEREEVEAGNILVSEDNDIHLIIDNEEVFNVFDLEDCVLRCYPNQERFEEDYPTKEVYSGEDIKIILKKGINLE